jgi:hypothetical protein
VVDSCEVKAVVDERDDTKIVQNKIMADKCTVVNRCTKGWTVNSQNSIVDKDSHSDLLSYYTG